MVADHTAYLIGHRKAGRIVSAGKTDDGAAAIFTSKSWPAVEEILKQDPYVRNGVAKVASHTVWGACEPEK
jgi:uncharacterized protein YciI